MNFFLTSNYVLLKGKYIKEWLSFSPGSKHIRQQLKINMGVYQIDPKEMSVI